MPVLETGSRWVRLVPDRGSLGEALGYSVSYSVSYVIRVLRKFLGWTPNPMHGLLDAQASMQGVQPSTLLGLHRGC